MLALTTDETLSRYQYVKVGLVDQGQKLAASDAILKKHRAERRGTESKPEQHPSLA